MTNTISRFERLMTSPRPWLSDGGLETDLIFHGGFDLPLFASFHLLESERGRVGLQEYFDRFVDIARQAGTGFVLDTPTWRSGRHWGRQLGRSATEMDRISREAVEFTRAYRDRKESDAMPIIVNGVVGPAGDGYAPENLLTVDDAQAIHQPQIRAMAGAGAELISAITLTHAGEAIGIARAAAEVGLPSVISFTLETDGRLPDGQELGEAIAETDAATGNAPAYYMINCAHPDHFAGTIRSGDWRSRIGGVRANASRLSHAELDEAEELDDGDPQEFGALYVAFAPNLPGLRVIGGCCGTDHRHVGCAARHLVAETVATAA